MAARRFEITVEDAANQELTEFTVYRMDDTVRVAHSSTPDLLLDDVLVALRWVAAHHATLHAPGGAPATRLVFGGYSSGAHVAATLLQRAELQPAAALAARPSPCTSSAR